MSLPKDIDHGRKGNIRVTSQWNTDRDPPSRQVWVTHIDSRGRIIITSSGTLVCDLGRVDGDSRNDNYELTPDERAFAEKIYEEFEGAAH